MKKLYIIFMWYLAVLSAALLINQSESTAPAITFFITYIASIILAITFGEIVLAIYFEPLYTKIKWPLICLSILIVAITAYAISVVGKVEFLGQLGVYTYIPLFVALVLGNIFYVQITNRLKREKIDYDSKWKEILFGNEKINALETEIVKKASTRLYQVSLGIVAAVVITATDIVVIIATLIGIIVAFKYFKIAALYLKTKAYIITEIIYFGGIVLTAVMFYVTEHPSVIVYPMVGFIVFKMGYYNALKQKLMHEKMRAY